MKEGTIKKSIKIAKQYIKDAENALPRETDNYWWAGNKRTATLKRRSMDLTNILADLRQGR